MRAKAARPGYELVIDHEATKAHGMRMYKWVPVEPISKEE